MIPLRYRERLPPYWYENEVAEFHFVGAGGESEYQAEMIRGLGKQLLVPYSTYGLDVWDWIYFGDTQLGGNEQRRAAIRKKNLAKARFTLSTLRSIAKTAGSLLGITEDFQNKEIVFEFAASTPINLPTFLDDFERIRPVHVKRVLPAAKIIAGPVVVSVSVSTNGVNYPICGRFKARAGQQGAIAKSEVLVSSASSTKQQTYQVTGKFKARKEA